MRKITNMTCAAILLSTTALSSATISSALANSQKPTTSLDTVTVIATKNSRDTFDTPGMVTVINADDPSNAGSSSVKDLLEGAIGVEFNGSARRNGQNITMRGYGSNGLTILLDGVRQKSESAHDGKFFVDPNLLKKVEIVRGPSSTLYGSGGLGGVIAFETKNAADLLKKDQKLGAMTSLGFSSVNDEWLASQSVYGRSEKFDVLLNAVTRNSGDIKLASGDKLESEDKILNGMFKLGYSINDFSTLKLNISGYQNDAVEPNNPQSDTDTDLFDKKTNSTNMSLAYEFSNPENPWLNLKTTIYHNEIDIDEADLVSKTRLSRQITTEGFTLENQSTIAFGENSKNILSYGIEYYSEEQDGSDSRNSDGQYGAAPDAKTSYQAAFLQNEINIGNLGDIPGELLIIPGVRIDGYKSKNETGVSLDENKVSPKLALTYKPKEWLMLFGNYAEGFRAPNMTETFTTGTHFSIPFAGNNVFIPNPDLRPETNESLEFGFGVQFKDVAKKDDHLKLKFSRFDIKSEDFIDLDVDFSFAPCCGTTQSVNVEKASLWGHEFEGGYENDIIRATAGYSYITGKNDLTGEYLTNITPLTFKTDFALKVPAISSFIGLKSTYAAEHDKVNEDEAKRDGYAVHDVYLQINPKGFSDLTVNLGVDNLFNKEYERVFAGSIEPARNYKANISYKW